MSVFSISLLAILIFYLVYYVSFIAHKPKLIFQPTQLNHYLTQNLPKLSSTYFPTPFLVNTHLQMIWLGITKKWAPSLEYDRQDFLTTPDGGTISVDWVGLDLPDTTPTVLILHTISGDPQSMRSLVRHLNHTLNWRIAFCVRRGHGTLPLTSAKFNMMGSTSDFQQQLNHVHKSFPESPLYAVGVSMGSGVLARYLGSHPNNTIKAAVLNCPAYDARKAFDRVLPYYSRMMAKKLIRLFITPNEAVLGKLGSYQRLSESNSLTELQQNMYEVAGFEDFDSFFAESNPGDVLDKITTPLLVLNAEDDLVCHIDNLYEHIEKLREKENLLFAITKRGSHCGFFEGWGAKSWANTVTSDYFSTISQYEQNN